VNTHFYLSASVATSGGISGLHQAWLDLNTTDFSIFCLLIIFSFTFWIRKTKQIFEKNRWNKLFYLPYFSPIPVLILLQFSYKPGVCTLIALIQFFFALSLIFLFDRSNDASALDAIKKERR
jgi:hypothetical protein